MHACSMSLHLCAFNVHSMSGSNNQQQRLPRFQLRCGPMRSSARLAADEASCWIDLLVLKEELCK